MRHATGQASRTRRSTTRSAAGALGLATVMATLLLVPAAPAGAGAAKYNPNRSGHPLRIAAYALHPVGWFLDRLIFYPAWRIGQNSAVAAVFGVERWPASEAIDLPPAEGGGAEPASPTNGD